MGRVELPTNAVQTNELEAKAPFRYLRFREPPYTDRAIKRIADDVRPLLANGVEATPISRTRRSPPLRSTRSALELLG